MQTVCSCVNEPTKTVLDPQTPAPLLQNEYFNSDTQGTWCEACTLKLKDKPHLKGQEQTYTKNNL